MPREIPEYSADRFGFGTDDGGRPISFRPKEVLVRHDESDGDIEALLDKAAAVLSYSPANQDNELEVVSELDRGWLLVRATGGGRFDPIRVSRLLRAKGIVAQPNHVYFVNSLRPSTSFDTLTASTTVNPNMFAPNMFAPNMFAPNMFAPNMFAPNMFAPNMFAPNMFAPNMFAAGLFSSCCCGTGVSRSEGRAIPELNARHAEDPGDDIPELNEDEIDIQIHVLDVRAKITLEEQQGNVALFTEPKAEVLKTDGTWDSTKFTPLDTSIPGGLISKLHDFLERIGKRRPSSAAQDVKSLTELAVEPESPGLGADTNGDKVVDPVTGHGAFIESIIRRTAGDIAVTHGVAGTLGDVDDADLSDAMAYLRAHHGGKYRILNLSLSGYNEDDRPGLVLADAITDMQDDGWLVVASAGNEASCRLAWPAALEGVVAVAAIGDCGPAWFSNYGPWVDACAAGVNVVSEFPNLDDASIGGFVVSESETDGVKTVLKASAFSTGWATWSGTSFSAPFVAAKLAISMMANPKGSVKATYDAAIEAVILDPDLRRIHNYGTIVSDT